MEVEAEAEEMLDRGREDSGGAREALRDVLGI